MPRTRSQSLAEKTGARTLHTQRDCESEEGF